MVWGLVLYLKPWLQEVVWWAFWESAGHECYMVLTIGKRVLAIDDGPGWDDKAVTFGKT